MKTFKKGLLILLMSLTVVACKKDDDGGDDPQAGEGTLTAKVDGANYTATLGVTALLSGSGDNQAFAISGGTADSENLQIIITGFDGAGTYDISLLNIGTYSYLPDPSNPDPSTVVIYTASSGELNLSSFDGNTAQGTFNFSAANLNNPSDTVEVTNGEFNIEVTNQ
ncbi:MAG: hypothetical protein CMC70_09900 [Flavobacteriaceae bacterium]|mgnify:CR=1 FL=1|nr:hypothetical protein [Flavobacteriaceae bacterium]